MAEFVTTIFRKPLTGGRSTVGRSLIAATFFIIVSITNHQVYADCKFPARWTGSWFQSGIRHSIKIGENHMTSKGFCLENDGDKFLMELKENDGKESCYRCVVIHEKHENVLQYKETYCDESRETLEQLCAKINGDAQLHSMFRENASPINCPIRGPLTFGYNRGHGDCHNPVSSVDSCSDETRLLFRYQACPDVPGTESTAEELICLAIWREGSTRYLVGRMEHGLAKSNEDRFRCFVYAKAKLMYSIAQSGDATCFGLISATEGPKTMKLYRANYPSSNCQFPSWATIPHNWHRLDGAQIYSFNKNSFSIDSETEGKSEAQVKCLESHPGHHHHHHHHNHHSSTGGGGGDKITATFITHVIMGCSSGYSCIHFVKRGNHVIELQAGNLTRYSNEACEAPNFDRTKSEYTTLISSTPERIQCPYKGQYVAPSIAAQLTTPSGQTSILGYHSTPSNEARSYQGRGGVGSCSNFLKVRVGCASDGDLMEFQDDCTPEPKTESFQCHGAWEENGTSYLIASLKGTKLRYCFIYAEMENLVKFTSLRKSCKRDIHPGISGVLSFNVTSQGQCDPDYNTSSALSSFASNSTILDGILQKMLWALCLIVHLVLRYCSLNR
ncbi:hypothetical protein CHUAL_014246 [Chamberlinius hualienensis]